MSASSGFVPGSEQWHYFRRFWTQAIARGAVTWRSARWKQFWRTGIRKHDGANQLRAQNA
jgi:hypothetical protein